MSQGEPPEEAIFEAALQLSPGQRAAYLDETCIGDPELRRRVENLLGAFERAGGFMTQPAMPAPERTVRSSLPTTEKSGDKIDHYKLLEKIGEGGCGMVYVAEQAEPVRRRVALKVIKLGMDTKEVIARFEAERQALAMMDHPNIAKILDAGATDTGRPYFVMELVRGIKVTDYCDQHQLSPRERLDLFIQVCRAIQHAHQKGVIHRDIKPSNVLVASDDGVPVPKVIDFGIAKATQGRLTNQTVYTAFEQFIGTPAYMSPEQAALSLQDIDTRSDIYSLGILLYELLTGTTPFDGKELLSKGVDEMRRTIREVEPVKPSTRLTQELLRTKERKGEKENGGSTASNRSTLNQPLSTDLDWIVMKCLEKDRTRRYETVSGLASDIARHLRNEPILARPPSKLYLLQKLARRNRAALAAATVMVFALLLALVILTVSNLRIRHEQSQKEVALESAKAQLWTSLKSQAEARRYSHRIGQRLESLAALNKAAQIKRDDELRDAAIAALAVPDLRLGASWQAYDTNSWGIAFDANYERYALVDEHYRISVRTATDGREIKRFATSVAPQPFSASLLFSPDSRLLAKYEAGNRWSVWRVEHGQLVVRTPPVSSTGFAFSEDSSQIAIPVEEAIVIFDLPTGKERIRWRYQHLPHALSFSPDDRQLTAASTKSGVISIFDATNGQLLSELPAGASGGERPMTWHPSGKYLMIATLEEIQFWDVKAAAKVSTLGSHAQPVTTLSFDPTGNWLISDSWDGPPRLWQPSPGQEWIRFFSGLKQLRFSRDGRWAGAIYPGGGKAQLLEFIPSQIYHTFVGTLGDNQHAFGFGDISVDGRLLALASGSGVSVRELPSGRELALLPVGPVVMVRFHPNGKELLISSSQPALGIWPIDRTASAVNRIRLGPPRNLPLPFVPHELALARDGRTLAMSVVSTREARIMDLDTGNVRDSRFPHPNMDSITLSPDAQWLATAGWFSAQAQVWNTQTEEATLTVKPGERTRVSFTPDGRKIVVTTSQAYTFYDFKTHKITHRFQRQVSVHLGWIAFTSDGKLMAMEISPGLIRLCEVETGRTIAHLQDPNGDVCNWMGFTPDGTQLVVAAASARAIHRWDLRALRVELKAMGLDWAWPEFPPTDAANPPALEVEVIETAGPDQRDNSRQRHYDRRFCVRTLHQPDERDDCQRRHQHRKLHVLRLHQSDKHRNSR
jgi:eukaryotic-like serine/threonine-protein kinase